MSNFKVISSGLNLRSSPVVSPDNQVVDSDNNKVVLPKGQIVTRIGSEPASEKWWKVRTIVNGNTLEGFVSKSFLAASTKFSFPQPDNSIIGNNLDLWATFYYIPEVDDNPNGVDLLDISGNKLGVKLADRDWCNAALEGTVSVRTADGKVKTFNFAGVGATSQVDCRPFFPNLTTIEKTNKSRFAISKGKFGEGVNGLKLVPYRSIAVDRTDIAIGTVIYIPSARGIKVILPSGETDTHDGYFLAADVGGAIKDHHIDVFIGVADTNPFPFVKSVNTAIFEAFIITSDSIIDKLKAAHIA
ncbi:3D domain-containing protein [Chamaesiphon sp. VAR_48_metabat_135_sub]|uniref:3D domain-containing protein n=1 Tax=Chamaesiphon sp. VAR_48_metabat_135_sub TaxID=2964699 RepID=UPI00286C66E2|nr:3D domain-containing protein [Chamaesiphon sp. VAR_48_metabat_135_sub]